MPHLNLKDWRNEPHISKKEKDRRNNAMRDFIIELKQRIRNTGRSSVMTISELDELFIKHQINVKELENDRTDITKKTSGK